MHQKIRIIASLAFLAASPIEARSAPANTLPDLWRELSACVKAPGDSAGSELTIIFALKRDGSLLGKPRITHSHLLGDAMLKALLSRALSEPSPNVCPSASRMISVVR